jgi:peptidyl-dipeptidase A
MMGQLFASQVFATIRARLYPNLKAYQVTFIDDPRVGQFLREKVFAPGKSMDWRQLTRHATGEDLSPKAFAAEFQQP